MSKDQLVVEVMANLILVLAGLGLYFLTTLVVGVVW